MANEEIRAPMEEKDIDIFLKYLYTHYSNSFIRDLAQFEKTPSEILKKLAKSDNEIIRIAISDNPNVTAEVLSELSDDCSMTVRVRVAWNSKTPLDMLDKLSQDDCELVRVGVAYNTNTTAEILHKMAQNEKIEEILRVIAIHNNVDSDTLDLLFESKIASVHYGISHSEKAYPDTLDKIARFYPKDLDADKNYFEVSILYNVARNQNTCSATLLSLADCSNSSIQFSIAAHENATPDILEKLLLKSSDIEVVRAIAHNHNATPAILTKLSKHKDWIVREYVAMNKNTPHKALKKLSWNFKRDIRFAVAENPSTEYGIIKRLTFDFCSGVRTVAKKRLSEMQKP